MDKGKQLWTATDKVKQLWTGRDSYGPALAAMDSRKCENETAESVDTVQLQNVN